MNVLFLNYWYDAEARSPEGAVQYNSTILGWANALHAEGANVTVLSRFRQQAEFLRQGVRFVLLPDSYGPRVHGWHIPFSFHRAARRICAQMMASGEPTAVHFNGLLFPVQLRTLRAMLPKQSTVVVQHHAEKPWEGVRGRIQKLGLEAADGFFFTATEQASPWIERGLILPRQRIYEVMEGSTGFRRQDRNLARAQTGITGEPVVLWVGRLIALKDPLAVLRGFEPVVRDMPRARLYMVYGSADLLPAVRDCIAGSALLARSVTLLGFRPHPEQEPIYNSADYFVLGSHYEGSGYSLAEALACGVVPVVTDIPSFRAMTDGGKIGACWVPGDAAAFTTAFLQVSREPLPILSDHAVRFFEEHLSYRAIARKAIRAYGELAAKRAVQ